MGTFYSYICDRTPLPMCQKLLYYPLGSAEQQSQDGGKYKKKGGINSKCCQTACFRKRGKVKHSCTPLRYAEGSESEV